MQDTTGASHHVGASERNNSGVWGRQWGAPISEQNVHEDLRRPSTPSPDPTSSGSFPTPQHMDFREEFTNHGDWEAALEVEIENPENLGGAESSPPPSSPRRGPQLRRRRMAASVAQEPSLQFLSHRNNAQPSGSKKKGSKKRAAWSNADLQDAIKALDVGYTFGEVSQAFNIPKSSLRDHYLGKRTSRKMGGKGVLTKEEDEALCKYVLDMAEVGFPLTPIQLQQKAAEITQERPTPFTNGMPGRSWLKWFLYSTLKFRLDPPKSWTRRGLEL